MIASSHILSFCQPGLLLAAIRSNTSLSENSTRVDSTQIEPHATILPDCSLHEIRSSVATRTTLTALAAGSAGCTDDSLGPATIIVLGVGAVLLASRFSRRFALEWSYRYRPFGQLNELHALLDLDQPSWRGALDVFVATLRTPPTRKRVALAATQQPHQLKDSPTMTVYSLNQYYRLKDNPEVNAFGALFARTFIALLRGLIDEGQTYFDDINAAQPRNSPEQVRVISIYLNSIVAATRQFLGGLDAMAPRELRFVYYRDLYGAAFAELIRLIDAREFQEIARDVATQTDRGYEARLYLSKTYNRLEARLAQIDALLDKIEH